MGFRAAGTVAPVSTPSDPRTLVMHGLRLKGFGEAAAVGEAVGVSEADAKPVLDTLVAEGLAAYRGRASVGLLAHEAGPRGAGLPARGRARRRGRDAVDAAYRRFLALNTQLLSVCTEWQLREVDGESTVNDHSDRGYDSGVIEKLGSLHASVEPICHDLGQLLDRFGGYGPRLLTDALERVPRGRCRLVHQADDPEHHTVWFEMHEDLLCTLGIERGSEGEH